MSERVSQRVSFATAPELNKISGSDVAEVSCKLIVTVSVVIVIIAALNLILDFDMIETGAKIGAPKYMEWYGAFGLMVTLIWLYFEILRLLSKLRSRE